MSRKGIVAAVVMVILAIALIVVVATAVVEAEIPRRDGPPLPEPPVRTQGQATSTFIPAPKAGLFWCVWDVDGFVCIEVTPTR